MLADPGMRVWGTLERSTSRAKGKKPVRAAHRLVADPFGLVFNTAPHLRHLTESQQAAVAAKVANMRYGYGRLPLIPLQRPATHLGQSPVPECSLGPKD